MRIAIAGATGLIGSQLTALARKEGHEVVEIARETGFDLLDPEPAGSRPPSPAWTPSST